MKLISVSNYQNWIFVKSENLLVCELMKLPTATKSLLRSAGLSNEERRLILKNCKEVVAGLSNGERHLILKNCKELRLDLFFCDFMYGNTKFRKCWDFFKLVFTLSHGQ